MTTTDRRYPLYWPPGWQRAKHRDTAPYKVTEGRARDLLIHSLKLLGALEITISTNVALRHDGLPYANQPVPRDAGVAVYWTLGKDIQECCMACDKWTKVGHNMRAVGLAIDSLRQLKRCGASEILDRAFMGFTALPEKGGEMNWRIELGFGDEVATPENINVHYRARAKEAFRHEESLLRLNQARELALKECE